MIFGRKYFWIVKFFILKPTNTSKPTILLKNISGPAKKVNWSIFPISVK